MSSKIGNLITLATALFLGAASIRGQTINLQSYNGQWLCAEGGGGQGIWANRGAASTWETFTLTDLNGGSLESGDPVALQALSGEYLCAEGGGGQQIVANRGGIGGWEVFTIWKRNGGGSIYSGDQVAIQACNGQYWCAEGGGGDIVAANRDWADGWETFTIVFGEAAPTVNWAPSSSVSPWTTSATLGQAVGFTVTGSCDAGLNEIGLELYDGAGNPVANLGIVSVGGSSYSHNFYWQPGSPGTYLIGGYAWNANRSQLSRTSPVAISWNVGLSYTPTTSLQATASAVQVGQSVSFTVSGSCEAGTNEIGLEQCDGNGIPFANLGNVGTGGAGSASHTFTWTATAPGTYYFDGYTWNVDRSQLHRTGTYAVAVSESPSTTSPGKPLVILAPSSPNVVAGGAMEFTVVGYGEPGVSEVGVEACDANGNVTANVGLAAVADTYGEHTATWIAPAPGMYYFCGYVWNSDRTKCEKTAPIAVGVYTESDPGSVDEDDWGDSDWGGDDWGTPDESCGYLDAQGNRHQTRNGHKYTIHPNGSVTRHVDSGPYAGNYTFTKTAGGNYTVTTPFGINYSVNVNYSNQTFRIAPIAGSSGSSGSSSSPLPTAGSVVGNRAIEQSAATRLSFPLLEDGDTVLLPTFVVAEPRANYNVDSYVGMHVMLKYYAGPQLASTGVVPGPGPVDMNSVSERERQRQYLLILERLIAEGKVVEQTRLYGPLTAAEAETLNQRLGKLQSFREGVADALVGAGVGAATTKNPYGGLIGMAAGVLLNMSDVFEAPTQLREGDIMVFTSYQSFAGKNRGIVIGTAINYYVINQNSNQFSNQTGQSRFELTQPVEPLYKAILREVFNGGGQPNPPAPPAGQTVLRRDPVSGRIVFDLVPTN